MHLIGVRLHIGGTTSSIREDWRSRLDRGALFRLLFGKEQRPGVREVPAASLGRGALFLPFFVPKPNEVSHVPASDR